MTTEEYGAMIRRMRQTAGLTQKELGMKCGVDEANADRKVRGWERGEYYPTLNVLRTLADALGVRLERLIP